MDPVPLSLRDYKRGGDIKDSRDQTGEYDRREAARDFSGDRVSESLY